MLKVDKITYKLNVDNFYSLSIKVISKDVEDVKDFVLKYFGEEKSKEFDISKPALNFTIFETLDNLNNIIKELESKNLSNILSLESEYISTKTFLGYLCNDFDIEHSTIEGAK